MDRFDELKKLMDQEQSKIEEFIQKFKTLSPSESREEFLSSVKYAKEMEQKIGHIDRVESGQSYSTNAYAELCAKHTLLLYQYATLLVYNRNLEKKIKTGKRKRKKRSIKMLDRHMKPVKKK